MKKIILCCLCLLPTVASAQAPVKDRATFVIEALEAQRNEAASRNAACVADANVMIEDLKRQLAEAKAKLTPTPSAEPAK